MNTFEKGNKKHTNQTFNSKANFTEHPDDITLSERWKLDFQEDKKSKNK